MFELGENLGVSEYISLVTCALLFGLTRQPCLTKEIWGQAMLYLFFSFKIIKKNRTQRNPSQRAFAIARSEYSISGNKRNFIQDVVVSLNFGIDALFGSVG